MIRDPLTIEFVGSMETMDSSQNLSPVDDSIVIPSQTGELLGDREVRSSVLRFLRQDSIKKPNDRWFGYTWS